MSEERVMVLTGASSGLGAEVAAHFAAKGFAIAMNYIIEEDSQKTYDRIASEVGEDRIMRFRADVANREQVRSMFDAVIERFGRVDILINFAGINRDAPFIEMTDEQWDSVISAHLKGHFVCSQEYVFHNPDRKGLIINLGAACGQIGRMNGANFCSAKGAIFALTKCLARELAPRIRVNCLVPGSIKTREVIDRYDLETEEGLRKELANLPMGRLGEFSELIRMVECIIGAEFTTGANFYVNGGQYMH
jgi:NAD(P)-dependent dehydrogenase (short-subunit alcohol dehydrogenase family)